MLYRVTWNHSHWDATIMMTSSNGNISALLALCAGNSLVTGEFPSQRPVTRSFDVFFDLRQNKWLSKQSWGWWCETHRAHYDAIVMITLLSTSISSQSTAPLFTSSTITRYPLLWRHDEHDSVSNHQPHGCLLNRLFRRRSKKTSKLRVPGLCVGNSPGPWIPRTKDQIRGKCFHLMTSSCVTKWAGTYLFRNQIQTTDLARD